jgi:hypothetical protein
MTRYEFLLFVHISAVVIWVGAGFLLVVLAILAGGLFWTVSTAQAIRAPGEAPAA